MRLKSAVRSILLLVTMGGCAAGTIGSVQAPGSVTLKSGTSAVISGTNWTIRFDSVVSDSRCPLGVYCIQAGEARLALQMTNPLVDPIPGEGSAFTLGSTPVARYGFRFTATEITPVKRVGKEIDRRDYRATIKIEPLTL